MFDFHHHVETAADALEMLKQGNAEFVKAHANTGNISPGMIEHLFENGQKPYAIIITCADSRVAPEHIFMTGLGELFVIRVAGNVIGEIELASAVYAAEHLKTKLLVVMGHTHCGAIESALAHGDDGAVAPITDDIRDVIGEETDQFKACELNVHEGLRRLTQQPDIKHLQEDHELVVCGAVYHTNSGRVDFL